MQTSRTLVLDARALIGRIMKRRLMTYILKTTCCCLWALHHANMAAIGFRRGPCQTLRLGSPLLRCHCQGSRPLPNRLRLIWAANIFCDGHYKIAVVENFVFCFAAWIPQILWRTMHAVLLFLTSRLIKKTHHQRDVLRLPGMRESRILHHHKTPCLVR